MAKATRLLIDVASGFVAELPLGRDFNNPTVGRLLKKYLKGASNVPVENRVKVFRLADTISDTHSGSFSRGTVAHDLSGIEQPSPIWRGQTAVGTEE